MEDLKAKDISTEAELTVEKIAEVATPKEAIEYDRFTNTEMTKNISDFQPLKDYFNVAEVDSKTQEQLNNVWEFFAQDTKDPGVVLKRIKMQEMRLAKPNVGDTRLNMLNNYIRILQQMNSYKDMKEAYENDSPR